ncbi:hypothetical protein F2Q69_00023129 [Brassica cretica]|uniref:Uncharacterized protein n=1 Tax=Brassica cretica TaxID=69181 RepID=A0A8S9QL06_BRACR|nr:hypothetical protein F2Q69_00023129 [Brassica cretica]
MVISKSASKITFPHRDFLDTRSTKVPERWPSAELDRTHDQLGHPPSWNDRAILVLSAKLLSQDCIKLALVSSQSESFELSFQCHRSEVNQHHLAEVMHVLLKSGQAAMREEAVDEMKESQSMVNPWHRSTVFPERGLSILYD